MLGQRIIAVDEIDFAFSHVIAYERAQRLLVELLAVRALVVAENLDRDGRSGNAERLACGQRFLLGRAGNQRKKEQAGDRVLHFTLFQEYSRDRSLTCAAPIARVCDLEVTILEFLFLWH